MHEFEGTPGDSVPPPWADFANADEKQQLATIETRINLRKASIDELLERRRLIARRCIKRMRRANGKD